MDKEKVISIISEFRNIALESLIGLECGEDVVGFTTEHIPEIREDVLDMEAMIMAIQNDKEESLSQRAKAKLEMMLYYYTAIIEPRLEVE